MKEIRAIISAYDEAQAQGKKAALATVVQVEGSSYRRPGARMLITEDGHLTGAISGGCLEGDAMRKALRVIYGQSPALVTYDTMDEDDATLGIGLGCNGIIQVLIEPLLPAAAVHPIALLKAAAAQRQTHVVATFFSLHNRRGPQPGTRLLLHPDGKVLGECPLPAGEEQCRVEAAEVLRAGKSRWIDHPTREGVMTAFFEVLPPATALVILGAGNDVAPLVDMAYILGWDTTVVDGMAGQPGQTRFASPCQILIGKPEQVLDKIHLDDRTLFALMTHNYNYDKAMLHGLCQRGARFVAMLGPRRKLARIMDEFEDEGRPLTPAQRAAIFSPAGLDIGADTPEEIALSILAEMAAFQKDRQGTPLRERQAPIHVG